MYIARNRLTEKTNQQLPEGRENGVGQTRGMELRDANCYYV